MTGGDRLYYCDKWSMLLFVAFLRLLDCEQSLSSPNFSEKENRTTARSLSVFQSIQFLNVTRLVASG